MSLVSPEVIEAYLNRKLVSNDWLKRQRDCDLDDAINLMTPVPKWGATQPWQHQKALFLLMVSQQRFMVYTDMGGGKTLSVLNCLRYRKQCGEQFKAIVFVPYVISTETWLDEVQKHAPELHCEALTGSTGTNRKALTRSNADIFVICYQSAVAMCTVKTGYVDQNGKKRVKWKVDKGAIDELFVGFDMLVCDEVHKVKSRGSLTFSLCRRLSNQCDWSFGLTGTPFGRDLLDLWPQFYVVDLGETLGTTLGLYRAAFFKTKAGPWGFDYKFVKALMPKLRTMIKHKSIRYRINDLHDMPPFIRVPMRLRVPNEAKGYVDASLQALQTAVKVKDKRREHYEIIQSNYMRLRQLSSGFLTLRGDDNDKLQLEFNDNPKLEEFANLVDAMPHDAKMVVFHHFVYTNTLLSRRLTDMKVGHARIWGGQRNPMAELRRFSQDSRCRVLVLNSKSGSSALNLQHASYIVFFEEPDSPIDRQQAERRVWRPGQMKRVLCYDLLVSGTVDHRLHAANQSGKDLLRQLLDGKPL